MKSWPKIRSTLAMGLLFLTAGSACALDRNYGTGDSIALDQMRVVVGFSNDQGSIPPASLGVGYTFIADTGATGVLVAAGGHMAFDELGFPTFDPNQYELDAQYLEQGVGGFEAVGLTSPYDMTVSGFAGFGGLLGGTSSDPPGDAGAYVVPGVRMLTAPNLNLGSFDGIMGMPGMVGKAMIVDLGNLTPLDLMAVGHAAAPPAPGGVGTTYDFNFGKLSFDPTSGQINPSDPLPTHADLPTLNVGVSTVAGGLATGNFLFDTGAQLSMISGDTARAIGIDPLVDAIDFLPVGGVGGSAEVPIVQIDQLILTDNLGNDLIFENLSVGVLDIDGLPVDGILGFNPFTTGYLDPILAGIDGSTGPDASVDGAFTEMMLDFTTDDWSMRLTENPLFTPAGGSQVVDDLFFPLDNQALFAWPAFTVPEPGVLSLMLLAGLGLVARRRSC